MKKFLFIVLIFSAISPTFAQRRNTKNSRTLTLAIAQRVLNEQINEGTADNILFTCRACYDPDDKSENYNFPLVTTYSPALSQFLVRKGYISIGKDGTEYFTAKAKQSSFFEAFGDGLGRLGGAGFRFANFRNPKITVNEITNPNSVPIQYEAVPTDLTKEFFRTNIIMKTTASFSFEDGKWSVCVACNGEDTGEVITSNDKVISQSKTNPTTSAQTLPAKVKSYLNKNYSGWKQTFVAKLCSSDFSHAVVAGDFDGDRKMDYAVKFIRGRKGYIVAFLERKINYEAHVLSNDSATSIKSVGLSIARKGEEYPIGGEYPDYIYGRLLNDALMIGECASHAGHYIYKNGKFQ